MVILVVDMYLPYWNRVYKPRGRRLGVHMPQGESISLNSTFSLAKIPTIENTDRTFDGNVESLPATRLGQPWVFQQR